MNCLFFNYLFSKPKILVFFVSFNCNLRCAMCSGWLKQKEIKEPSPDQIRAIFNDPVFKNNLEVVNITGGEPTLRQDLTEIIKIIIQSCTRLRRIDISTNGVNTPQVIDQVERILAILLPTNAKLSVSISLDGVGAVHEKVRQTQGVFSSIEQTIDGLKELMSLYPFFSLGFNMTISRLNYNAIEETRDYALHKGIGINYTLAAISDIGVESSRVREKFELTMEEKKKVASFLKKVADSGELDRNYADFLIAWLLTGKRQGRCAFRDGKSLLLEPGGEIYACGNFKEFKLGNIMNQRFGKMFWNSIGVAKYFSEKCAQCVSNCYIEETSKGR